MKKTLLTFFMAIAIQMLNAQDFQDRFFRSRGLNLFGVTTPSTLFPVYDKTGSSSNYTPTPYSLEHHFIGFGIGYVYSFRFNIIELEDEKSFSVEVPLNLAYTSYFTYDNTVGPDKGLMSFSAPIILQFNYGNGATYNSSNSVGLVAGFGLEYNLSPMFLESVKDKNVGDMIPYNTTYYEYTKVKKSWVQPILQLGIRYWNRKNKLKEISLKYGFGGKKEWIKSADSGNDKNSSMSLQITFMRILNY
ncbi:MAG: hypothetical protein GXO89_14460 [Chlorobi bacterium]|nr:hypothetical protein [Chlorobiota bacterium]